MRSINGKRYASSDEEVGPRGLVRREVKLYRKRNDDHKKVKCLNESSEPRSSFCKNENGTPISDFQGLVMLCKQYFSLMTTIQHIKKRLLINNDDVDILPPSHYEVKVAIQQICIQFVSVLTH